MKRRFCLVMIAALAVSESGASAVVIQSVAATGDPVPGAPGETFLSIGFAAIGPSGAAFRAIDTSMPTSERLWLVDTGGNLTPIAHTGALAPGTFGATFTFLKATPLADGLVGVSGRLTGPGVAGNNDAGFWLWDEVGGLRLLAREGDVVPGANGAVISNPTFNGKWTSAGELFYDAKLVGGDATSANDSAVLRSGSAGTSLFLREGDTAPGVPDLTLGPLFVNQFGVGLVVAMRLHALEDALILVDPSGDLALFYQHGDPSPGIPGANFTSLFVAPRPPGDTPGFVGEIATPTGAEPSLWYLDGNRQLVLVAREADALSDGFNVHSLSDAQPVLDGIGRVVFEANAVDANFDAFSSIIRYDPATQQPEIVARVDTPIPCVSGAAFSGFFRDPFTNARGDLAFWGEVVGVGIPRDSAIFARLPDETFVIVAREQQSFEATPGVFKMVEHVELNGLSDDGRLAFHLEFADHTNALFVAHLAEPGDRGLLRASRRSRGSERARCAHVAPAARAQ